MRRDLIECDICGKRETEVLGTDPPGQWASTTDFDVCPNCIRRINGSLLGAYAYRVDTRVLDGRLFIRLDGQSLGVNGTVLEANTWTELDGVRLIPHTVWPPPTPTPPPGP